MVRFGRLRASQHARLEEEVKKGEEELPVRSVRREVVRDDGERDGGVGRWPWLGFGRGRNREKQREAARGE